MNRKHTIEEYLNYRKIKKSKPNIKFSSDFIIGYPGETKMILKKHEINERSKIYKLLFFYI